MNMQFIKFVLLCVIYAKIQGRKSLSSAVDGTEEDDEVTYEEQVRMEEKLDAYKIRCTRRFTPGVCTEQVASVWTFDFQIQNCTERLGCPQSRRTNRFKSHRSCMRRCQSLVRLYAQILDYEARLDARGDQDHDQLINPDQENDQANDQASDDQANDYQANDTANDQADDQKTARRIIPQTFQPEDYIDEASGDEILNLKWMYGDDDDDDTKGLESVMLPSDDYFLFHQ